MAIRRFVTVVLVGSAITCQTLGPTRGAMWAFDAASIGFLISCIPLFRHEAGQMRRSALRNDANRGTLLLISAGVTGVILVAVGSELAHKGRVGPLDTVLVILTLCLAWLFTNLVYALHYARLFTPATQMARIVAASRFQILKSRIIGTSRTFPHVWE